MASPLMAGVRGAVGATTYVGKQERMALRPGSPAWNLLVIPDSVCACNTYLLAVSCLASKANMCLL